jgi:hypothetical protein
MERVTKVTLEVDGRREDFEINHAERILRMPANGGWHLPDDSKYEMHETNGLILKRTKKPDSKPDESTDN